MLWLSRPCYKTNENQIIETHKYSIHFLLQVVSLYEEEGEGDSEEAQGQRFEKIMTSMQKVYLSLRRCAQMKKVSVVL